MRCNCHPWNKLRFLFLLKTHQGIYARKGFGSWGLEHVRQESDKAMKTGDPLVHAVLLGILGLGFSRFAFLFEWLPNYVNPKHFKGLPKTH